MEPAPTRDDFSRSWTAGAQVGEYRLERRLGVGGMGAVYLATHVATGAPCALKTIVVQDPELLLRFQREVEAQARVDRHPNVLRIHSAGSADGRVYFAMDLATGGDLDQRLREGPLAPAEAARIARDLALGLEHVHRQGILHRDIKPQNVLFDERGTPKLVDFGLAQVAGAESLTQTGDLLGTPAYMAPEQALGQRERVDARTDVYALGALLYTTLTGRPPFSGGATLSLLNQVVTATPPPPSRLVPGDGRLDAIVLRCLAKEPARRFPSAGALAQALDDWLVAPQQHGRGPGAALALLAVALGGALAAALSDATPDDSSGDPPRASVARVETTAPPEQPHAPAPPPASVAKRPPPDPWELDEEQVRRHVEEVCRRIGTPPVRPPEVVPAELQAGWFEAQQDTLAGRWQAIAYGQRLREAKLMRYAQQFALHGAEKNPPGWLDLARWSNDPKSFPELFDPVAARGFYERAARVGNLAAGSLELGNSLRQRFWEQRQLPDLLAAAAWFADGTGRLRHDGMSDTVSLCAAEFASVQWLIREEGGDPDFERALELLLAYPTHVTAQVQAGRLILDRHLVDAAPDALRLLEAGMANEGPEGDEATVYLARLLREGLGEVPADPERSLRVLRERLPLARARDPKHWHWAPPLRVRYALASLLAEPADAVEGDLRLAATLWEEVARLDPNAGGWLRRESLRQLAELIARSDDPSIQELEERARARD